MFEGVVSSPAHGDSCPLRFGDSLLWKGPASAFSALTRTGGLFPSHPATYVACDGSEWIVAQRSSVSELILPDRLLMDRGVSVAVLAMADFGGPFRDVRVKSGWERFLASFVMGLARQAHDFSLTDREALSVAIANVVRCALADGEGGRLLAADRVRDVAMAHLGSTSFGVGDLARLSGMSRSKLYRVMEPYGGVARFMMRLRLEEARRRLTSRDPPAAICAVADGLGFQDASTFSRAFKREFGLCPKDVRNRTF